MGEGRPGVVIGTVIKVLFIFTAAAGVLVPLLSWAERKQGALVQDRIGPDRADLRGASLLGLLQPLADAIKLFAKEDLAPAGRSRFLHVAAPLLATIPVVAALAVIPFGGRYELAGTRVNLIVADVDWGVLWILAMVSIAALGPLLAGWASNSRWALLGGLRAAAQLISCEVAMGLSLLGVLVVFGSLRLSDMAVAQDQTWKVLSLAAGLIPADFSFLIEWVRLPRWGIFLQPLGFLLFLTCALAASRRPPFDLPEAGSELVAGHLTEYSAVRLGLFHFSQYLEMVVVASVVTSVFLGGWSVPYLSQATLVDGVARFLGEGFATGLCLVVHVTTFFAKVVAMLWLQLLVRWSMPRFRYDQLMNLCWKVLLPLALANGLLTAALALELGGK
jgi:NADH-quinone oxidoreductase subunit H